MARGTTAMTDWNLENFAKFWQDIDLTEAMRQKRIYIYGEPCDCGSSVCDECNPGWDQFDWRDEEPWDTEDYY